MQVGRIVCSALLGPGATGAGRFRHRCASMYRCRWWEDVAHRDLNSGYQPLKLWPAPAAKAGDGL